MKTSSRAPSSGLPGTSGNSNKFVVINSNSNLPQNFVIGNCLSCQALVKVSATADPESLVKCPRCAEQFKLYTVLDQFVPELEVVDAPSESNGSDEVVPHADTIRDYDNREEKTSTKFVVPKQLAAGAKKRRKKRRKRREGSSSSSEGSSGSSRNSSSRSSSSRESSSRSSSSRESSNSSRSNSGAAELVMVGSSPLSGQNETSGSQSSRSGSRTRTKSSSRNSEGSFSETMKIVLGGMIAIPIAYMLLFWIFNKDPLNLAPAIHRAFPFAVPEVLIPLDEDVPEQTATSNEGDERLPVPDLDPDDVRGNPDLGY